MEPHGAGYFQFSIEVVNLLKDMNMNAVRMSHYPPDAHFLDVCDSLGLFVLDELAGWQRPSYDSVVGRKLLREMISRDVNHPSVVMWDNANEGGWNTAYDKDFKKPDIQQREVTHPWGAHDLTNTAHYVNYDYPEFKGYYSNLYWARISDSQDHHFTVYSHTEDLFLRLFTPDEAPQPAKTAVSHPSGDLSFMLGIPPIGTKFKEAEELGPQSGKYYYQKRRVKDGALQIELTFDFR